MARRQALIRDQFYKLLRDTKWMIILSLVIAGALYAPPQIQELYRSIVANITLAFRSSEDAIAGGIDFAKFFLPVLAIAVVITLGAYQVIAESMSRIERPVWRLRAFARWLAPALGALPLLACAIAQFVAAPKRLSQDEISKIPVGSQLERLDADLAQEVGSGMIVSGVFWFAVAAAFVYLAFRWGNVQRRFVLPANRIYFRSWPFVLATLGLISGVTFLFLLWPVALPQTLGVFGVVAIFVLCVTGFVVHFSMLTIEYRIPYLPIVFVPALVAAIFDLNDNHAVRTISDGGSSRLASADRTADGVFRDWYQNRLDLASFDVYPVYIVTAQGGGIYAAYQTAVFLSRMQDYCPAFAHHLFAISSVSGGSVGAAIFAAALKKSTAVTAAATNAAWLSDPCPRITDYFGRPLAPPRIAVLPGDIEPKISQVLSKDFLSPLVAASLFPDFTQGFLPFPVPYFDRARSLEFSFENAFIRHFTAPNPLEESFLDIADPANPSMPALLINTTDAATGRRVLLSPFRVEPQPKRGCSSEAGKAGSVVHFQSLGQLNSGGPRPLDVPLSTAAGMSARFPWVTPAATVHVEDEKFKPSKKLRLVDGGYVDNSGVETALDLIQCLAELQKEFADKATDSAAFLPDGKTRYKRIRIHLIVLSGGDYPARDSYALGEAMEPIRTLLSARSSRAYVAIERAARDFLPYEIVKRRFADADIAVSAVSLKRTNLFNRFYDLPLGWAMSGRSRSIIDQQSGQFWNCDPDVKFTQKLGDRAIEADCIQLLVYHELNRSLKNAGEAVALEEELKKRFRAGAAKEPRVDHQAVMRCYRDKELPEIGPHQAVNLEALLDVWDEHPEWHDDRWLSYLLGSTVVESADFRMRSEVFSVGSVARIRAIWPSRFQSDEEAAKFVNQPQRLANRVYASRLGNGDEASGDGWRFRARGMIGLTGRENYRRSGQWIGVDLEKNPDLVILPSVSARIVFGFVFPAPDRNLLERYFNAQTEDWINARRVVAGGLGLAEQVAKKAKVFHACIQESKTKALGNAPPPILAPRL